MEVMPGEGVSSALNDELQGLEDFLLREDRASHSRKKLQGAEEIGCCKRQNLL